MAKSKPTLLEQAKATGAKTAILGEVTPDRAEACITHTSGRVEASACVDKAKGQKVGVGAKVKITLP